MTNKPPDYDSNFFIPPWLNLNNNFDKKNSKTVDGPVDELEKKIKELKSVEQWLNLNLNILQSTIQGLEVQKNTISALTAAIESKNRTKTKINPESDITKQLSNIMADSTLLWWKSVEDQMESILKTSTNINTPKRSPVKKRKNSQSQQKTKPNKRAV